MKVLHPVQLLAGTSLCLRPAQRFPGGSSLKGATRDPSPQGPLEPESEPGAVGTCSPSPGPALLSVLQEIEERRGGFVPLRSCCWCG